MATPTSPGSALARRAPILWLAALAWVGCDAPAPADARVAPATGELAFAVGGRIINFELADARCDPKPAERPEVLHVVVPAVAKAAVGSQSVQPALVTAYLPPALLDGDADVPFIQFDRNQPHLGATASAFNVAYDGQTYALLQVIARNARDTTDYQCRAARTDGYIELICNEALLMPWLGPGEAPGGSFRARFRCSSA